MRTAWENDRGHGPHNNAQPERWGARVVQTVALTPEILWVLGILALTVVLFVSDIVRVDVAAILIMVLLGMTSVIPGIPTLVPVELLFNGFSSNAVISIIAVMIIGAGLDRTGLMSKLARVILQLGGTTENRVIPSVAGTVGFISSFMQNVGAAALFLPVVSRICARTGLSMSRLLMPMGFAAILGGTMTMIGSSPLILLNDLILNSNRTLPAGVPPMATFAMFDVTPIGLALLASGIVYFIFAGRYVLPAIATWSGEGFGALEHLRETYGVHGEIHEVTLLSGSALEGRTIEEAESLFGHQHAIVGLDVADDLYIAPARDIVIPAGAMLAVCGARESVDSLLEPLGLRRSPELKRFAEALALEHAGISEIVIPPGSPLIGLSLREIRMRKSHGLSVLAVHRGESVIHESLRDHVLRAGDTLVAYSRWEDLAAVQQNRAFAVVTADFPHEERLPHKVPHALAFFALALGMILFTDIRLSLALMTGAVGMILTGVLRIDQAYRAVGWQSVFLLASLIPLGLAVESTGTAAWIAHSTLALLGDVPIWVIQAALAILATFFTLVTSNVGATVLLVPLAVNLALLAGANPAVFALTVALAASNSFFLPTHQVNALIMGPGGYRVKDYMRAGGVMTVIFLVVMLAMVNLIF
jgi:di/tricarboxylate transporter